MPTSARRQLQWAEQKPIHDGIFDVEGNGWLE